LDYTPVWVFGGTKPVAKIAKRYKMFSYISDGTDDINDLIHFLRGTSNRKSISGYEKNVIDRINANYPYPILRHHFGVPSLDATLQGIEKIAKSRVLDVISLGPDQNAQQYFFSQNKMKCQFDGAGGTPIRTKEDFKKLKASSQYGNYPLMRCYSGTEDIFQYASMLMETIDNAWAAIPLCWYNELDGRGTRPLEKSVFEARQLIKWHADRNIPVEVNEPHHWGLRDAHDVIPVTMAYISAYNAKKLGVRNYIAQYMFNNPNGLSFPMDLARILAMIEIVESLHDANFTTYRQTRTGLPLLNPDMNMAKGQLAASTFMQMIVKPHIIHVVGYCEADHAASSEDVIESCKIVKGVIKHTLFESFSIEKDAKIQKRKKELLSESGFLLRFIKESFSEYNDPLANPHVIAQSIIRGYIDAVHIVKNKKFKGCLTTQFNEGKCVSIDKKTGKTLRECERLQNLRRQAGNTNNSHTKVQYKR